jgi:hypothetical protein
METIYIFVSNEQKCYLYYLDVLGASVLNLLDRQYVIYYMIYVMLLDGGTVTLLFLTWDH